MSNSEQQIIRTFATNEAFKITLPYRNLSVFLGTLAMDPKVSPWIEVPLYSLINLGRIDLPSGKTTCYRSNPRLVLVFFLQVSFAPLVICYTSLFLKHLPAAVVRLIMNGALLFTALNPLLRHLLSGSVNILVIRTIFCTSYLWGWCNFMDSFRWI